MSALRHLLLLALGSLAAAAAAQPRRAVLTVSNPGDTQRHELVEVPAAAVRARLGLRPGEPFLVKNAFGQQVPSQLTHDSLLLVEASVRPGATARFILEPGTPQPASPAVYGRQYPERLDDIAWENDRTAYRVYGPALQRTGERSFGIDVWAKRTPDLIVERLYASELSHLARIDSLRAAGRAEEARQLRLRTTYHLNQGEGLDCYAVGPTLGGGAPALMEGDSLIMPYCYTGYAILDNGPLRFTLRLDYGSKTVGTDRGVTEHRLVRCDKGSDFCRMTVWYDGLTEPRQVAAGIVVHTADTASLALGPDHVLYADPTDQPAGHSFQLYTGLLFPEGGVATQRLMYARPEGAIAGHAIGRATYRPGERFTYYFGSAWSMGAVQTFAEWQLRAAEALGNLRQPLRVSLQ